MLSRSRAAFAAVSLGASLWASPPTSAHAAPSHTLRTHDGAVVRIGAFSTRRHPTIAAAVRVFGVPSSSTELSNNSCRVEWRRLRLRIDFANFGGRNAGETTCTRTVGRAQSVSVRGPRFRTVRGLRVGSPSTSIRRRHPRAEFRQGAWWLITAVSPFGDNAEYPVIRAVVRAGRVRVLAGWIGAAGE